MMKVFLVDDEIAIRENLRNSFPWEEKGYQLVGEAPDGEMALPMLRDLNTDILLTDIRMPFMDGMKLCEEVQRTMPWVERIILSGYDDFAYAQKAISLGVREYLLKPVTAAELEAALNRVRLQIEEKRRERDNLTAMRERLSSGGQFLRDKLLASLFTDEGNAEDDDALLSQMRGMGINLTAGCYAVIDIAFDAEGEARTIFTGGIRMTYQDQEAGTWISEFHDLDLRGNGSGVGLSSAGRVSMTGCVFSGWKTGLLAYGHTWANAGDCVFEDNETGFAFNSNQATPADSRFPDNIFRNNGTGLLLENVPSDVTLDLAGTVFSGNGTDIDNRCRQDLDLSQAIFQ